MTEEKITSILNWAYNKAVNGIQGVDSAAELANSYMQGASSHAQAAENLVKWQVAKCATTGFCCGIPGLMALPATLPANVTSVLYVQIRMIAAIALMGGYDLKSDKVRTMVYMCLVCNSIKEVAKQLGIAVGTKITKDLIVKNVSREVIKKINQYVGFRLLTKAGEKGVVNISKAVPLIGGVIGGTLDGVYTRQIGKIACEVFLSDKQQEE